MDTAYSIIVCLLYTLACLCLGVMLMRILTSGKDGDVPGSDMSGTARCVSSFLLGQGVLSAVWMLVALAGLFSPLVIASAVAVLLAGGLKQALPMLGGLCRSMKSALTAEIDNESNIWKLIAALTLFLIILHGLTSFLPLLPGHDAAAYYMVLAKLIAASHQFQIVPAYNSFSAIGLYGEMHFAALISIAGLTAARLFLLTGSISMALMLLSICRVAGMGRRGQWIALAVLFTSSSLLIYVVRDPKVDLLAGAFGMAAFYWALRVRRDNGSAALPLTAVFTGLAVIFKITYLVVLLPPVVILIVWRRLLEIPVLSAGSIIREFAPLAFSFGIWMLLPMFPHFIKNAIILGNPLAPFIGGSAGVTEQQWFSEEITRRIVLTYPFALTFMEYPFQLGRLSPLALLFLPLVFIFRPRFPDILRSPLFQLTAVAFLGLVLWVWLRPSIIAPRYYFAPLFILIMIGAAGAEHVTRNAGKFKLLNAVVILFILLMMGSIYRDLCRDRYNVVHHEGLRLLTGDISTADYFGPSHEAYALINEQAKPGERVLQLGYYTYWFRPDILQCMYGEKDGVCAGSAGEETWARASILTDPSFIDYFIPSREPYSLIYARSKPDKRIQPSGLRTYWFGPDIMHCPHGELNGVCISAFQESLICIYKRGFRYVFIDRNTHEKVISALGVDAQPPEWLSLTRLYDKDKYSVYRMDAKTGAPSTEVCCRKLHPPAWRIAGKDECL